CRLEGGVELRSGKKPEILLEKIINYTLLENDVDTYVLDFFAGSATTPAVAHKMNKKYLAIEMGEYFNELVLKRMKYTFYGNSGGVKSLVNGGFLKYLSLEQYEDTLENSQLHSTKEAYVEDLEKLKEFMSKLYASKYLSLYKDFSLKESKALLMNEEVFNNPFDFTLRVNIESEIVEKRMDLIETFNTLKGLEVQRIKARKLNGKRYVFVSTEDEVIIWREFDESLDKKEELVFLKEQCDLSKELYMNGITQTHTKKELVAKELVFELRALLVAGVDLND
ncbi:MAG TPA: hypothetical protein ENK66_03495, partial [Arcobacter sp.]|nr:hypothetical protein [Arcobacter sp.]